MAPWLNENRSSELAASKVTQPPARATMVCEGSSQARAARQAPGASVNSASAINV